MPPSFENLFVGRYAAAAARAAADTGLYTSVVLAQWLDETAAGTSRAFLLGNNFAGVSPGGKVASYPSQAAGLTAYIDTMNDRDYDPVRAAKKAGAREQAIALGESPWAGGQYRAIGGGPGSALVGWMDALDLTTYDGAEQSLNPQPPKMEAQKMHAHDPVTGGIVGTNPDGDGYGFLGAPYPGGLNEHPEWKAGQAESGARLRALGSNTGKTPAPAPTVSRSSRSRAARLPTARRTTSIGSAGPSAGRLPSPIR